MLPGFVQSEWEPGYIITDVTHLLGKRDSYRSPACHTSVVPIGVTPVPHR